MNELKSNTKGYVLPIVLIILMVLLCGASYYLEKSTVELKSNTKNRDYEICILIGKNAIAIGEAKIEKNSHYSGTKGNIQDENGGYYTINVFEISENQRYLEIFSQYKSYQKYFICELEISAENLETHEVTIEKNNWRMEELE